MSDEWTWELSDRAAKRLDALDAETQQRVLDKLEDVVSDEFRDPSGFARALTDARPWQSLRVGDYRVLVRFDRETETVQVGTVGHRSTIYDDVP